MAITTTPNQEAIVLTFTCSTCGRDAATPRVMRDASGAIVEGCVDAMHEGFREVIAVDHPEYPAWLAQARAAGITGRFGGQA